MCHLSQTRNQMKNRLWLKSGWNKIHHRPEKRPFIHYQASSLNAAFETQDLFLVQEWHRSVHDTNQAEPQSSTWLCCPTVIPHSGMKVNKSFWVPLRHQSLPDMVIYSKSFGKPFVLQQSSSSLCALSTMHSSINPFLHHFDFCQVLYVWLVLLGEAVSLFFSQPHPAGIRV